MAASPATKPERMPGTLERLDRLPNATSRGKPLAPEPLRGLQAAQRRLRLVEVDLGIALVRRDHEAVAVGQLEQRSPVLQRHHAPVGLPGEQT